MIDEKKITKYLNTKTLDEIKNLAGAYVYAMLNAGGTFKDIDDYFKIIKKDNKDD